jgi:acetyltransferase
LGGLLNPAASLSNPVDMLAAATPHQYASCLQLLLADPAVNSVMVILPPPPMHTAGGIAKAIIPVIYTADKPVVVALMGESLIQEAVEHFRAARVPEYRFPERAAEALAVLHQRSKYLSRLADIQVETEPDFPGIHTDKVESILEKHDSAGFLEEKDGFELVSAYGIPTTQPQLARTAEEAVKIATEIGYPVAMKISSPQITHKSDVGGVLLNLQSSQEVITGFGSLVEKTRSMRPDAEISGVHLQAMLSGGQDVIIGAIQDKQFGTLVMFGSGGIEVEKTKDVRFMLAPISEREAEEMIAATWAGKKLAGFRSFAPADKGAVVDALLRLARLAADYPRIAEIEINPLNVQGPGTGAFAVDVRVRVYD